MKTAPFHADLADGPAAFQSVWRKAVDQVRLRLVHWPAEQPRGTVLLFPGRSEYAEKYGPVARELTSAGFGVLAIDWRGQGLSDRLADDPRLGHVVHFLDYQKDVGVVVELAAEMDLPKPWFLLGHSMGGCIGLRALASGLAVDRAVFSAPMWGIEMPVPVRPLAHILPPIARALKAEERFAPGTRPVNYLTETDFQENTLTTDRETYAWLNKHAEQVEEFALGGPSLQWIGEATTETRALANIPRPDVPVLTFLGTEEAIVSATAIRSIHADWPSGALRMVPGAKHELMMEADPARRQFMDETLAFFGENQTSK